MKGRQVAVGVHGGGPLMWSIVCPPSVDLTIHSVYWTVAYIAPG